MKGHASSRTTGQSLWVSQASRELIEAGSLIASIEDQSITGVAVSPEAVCRTLIGSVVYDAAIARKLKAGLCGKELLFDLILEDVHYAADLLRHVFDRTDGTDGWSVLPVSPLISDDVDTLLHSVLTLHSTVKRPNMLIKVPGLPGELTAIEEIAFKGIPYNIACIYSHDQFLGAADAHLRGIERRIAAGLKPAVTAFISIEISRLAASLLEEMPPDKATRAASNIAENIYRTMCMLHTSPRWEQAYNQGARPLRIVWVGPADNQTTDSTAALFEHLAAPFTVMAMSERNIEKLFQDPIMFKPMRTEGEDENDFASGFDYNNYAAKLQEMDAALQVQSWITLLEVVAQKSAIVVHKKTSREGSQ